MRSKISKTSISLICLMLVASSAEAGYKSSSYRSSYKSSFRPSTITRSYNSSTRSQASRTVNDTPAPASTKPLTTSQKAMIAGSGAALTVGAVSASSGHKPSESTSGKVKNQAGGYAVVSSRSQTKGDNEGAAAGTTPKKSVSGSELVAKKGTIPASSPTSEKSSSIAPAQHIPGTSGRDYSNLRQAAPDNVRTVIRERERSGADWTTLALMYWMMSSNNSHASSLTSSDKGWIQQQIEEQESSGASREAAINELKAAGVDTSSMTVVDNSQHASTVSFSYDMPTELKAGKVWTFVVNATWNDKKQAPSCELQGAKFMADKDKLYGMWKAPETVGQKTQMKCKAFGVEEIKTLVSV